MSLRTKVLRGGFYLLLRHGLSVAVTAIGVVLLTRAIGPTAYGLYAIAYGIYVYLFSLGQWGVDVYLIRQKDEPQPQDYHQAFSLVLLLGAVGAGSVILALPLLERWLQLVGFKPLAIAVFAVLPIQLLGVVPLARLERALDYRKVALSELSGKIALYAVALPLAYQGLGSWAPVWGLWSSQLLISGLLYWQARYWPRFYWEFARVRRMVGYGLGYSASDWVWNARYLVNPLIVGRYGGADAVGYVDLAIRLTDQLSHVVVLTTWRLSVAAFARLQEDKARLVRAVSEGMSLQLMAVGPILGGFGLVAPWLLPLLFGPQWLPVLEVYPFIAAGTLVNAMFTLHSSALYVLRRIWEVASLNLLNIFLFAGSALLLVPYLGFKGYGWAEMVALPSYILPMMWFQLYLGRLRYAQALVWLAAWIIPLFSWQLGPWTCISVIVPLIWPATRSELLQAVSMVWGRVYGRWHRFKPDERP